MVIVTKAIASDIEK